MFAAVSNFSALRSFRYRVSYVIQLQHHRYVISLFAANFLDISQCTFRCLEIVIAWYLHRWLNGKRSPVAEWGSKDTKVETRLTTYKLGCAIVVDDKELGGLPYLRRV